MHRRSAFVHWVGLISLLLSLFTPLITADASAEAAPEPDVSVLSQDAGTPEPPATTDPTAVPTLPPPGPPAEPITPPAVPTIEPTLPPAEPTVLPTEPPTPEPTAEPSFEPQSQPKPANRALAAAISLSVTGPETVSPGETATYTYTVTNSGAVPVTTMEVWASSPNIGSQYRFQNDPLRDDPRFQCGIWGNESQEFACELLGGRSLAPGESIVLRHFAQVADSIACDSTLTATIWLVEGGSGSDSHNTTVVCEPELSVSISMSGPDNALAGSTLDYTITLTNSGPSAVSDAGFSFRFPVAYIGTWSLTDPLTGAFPPDCNSFGSSGGEGFVNCSSIALGASASASASAMYSFKIHEANADPTCAPVVVSAELTAPYEGKGSVTTTLECLPGIEIEVSGPARPVAGNEHTYAFTVRNTGTTEATNVGFNTDMFRSGSYWMPPEGAPSEAFCGQTDAIFGRYACRGITLAPGESFTLELTTLVNTAQNYSCGDRTISARLTGSYAGQDSLAVFVNCTDPSLDIAIAGPATAAPGEPISYTMTLTNQGNGAAEDASFTAELPHTGTPWTLPEPSPDSCEISGTTLTCNGLRVAERGGQVTIIAASTLGSDPALCEGITASAILGGAVPDSDTVHTSVTCSPALSLAAEGRYLAPTGAAPAGAVAYTFKATNAGNTTVTDVTIQESPSSPPFGLVLTCTIDGASVEAPVTLGVGKVLECTSTHVLSQPQLDAGRFGIIIQASGQQAGVVRQNVDTPLPRNPSIAIASVAQNEPEAGFNRGDVVTFGITVTNTGNVTLTGITVTDDNPAVVVDVACGVASLAPGEDAECSATATISQDDVEVGPFTSTPRVTATAPQGTDPATVSAIGSVTVATDNTAGIGLWMSASPMPDALVLDTEITYELRASNIGKVTLTGVTIVDESLPDLSDLSCSLDGSRVEQPVALIPGQDVVCTATYTVTPNDVDRGMVTTTASVTAHYGEEEVSDTASLTVGDPSTRQAEVEITTMASRQNGVTAGTDITYTYSIRNTGTVTLTNLTVTDDTITGIDCGDGTNIIGTLAPGGEAIECTATHTVTQAFIDAFTPAGGETTWSLTLTATVIADAPSGMVPTQVTDDASVTISGPRLIAVTLTKTVTQVSGEDVPAGEPVNGLATGQEVTYALTATNTGDVTLSGVMITDALIEDLACDQPAALAPGETLTCTDTLQITQEMIDTDTDREILNQGTVTTLDPQGNEVRGAGSALISLETAAPRLSLEVTTPENGAREGTELEIAFTVTNTGNVTLHDVELTSDLDGLEWAGNSAKLASLVVMLETSTGSAIGDLAPGETVTIHASYIVTRADAEAGSLRFSAVASGYAPDEEIVSSTTDEIILEIAQPAPVQTPTPDVDPTPTPSPAPDPTSTPSSAPDPTPIPAEVTPGATAGAVTKLPSTGAGSGTGTAVGFGMMLAAMGLLAVSLGLRARTIRGRG